jgi:GNAT superfamily N-acetyltransferase
VLFENRRQRYDEHHPDEHRDGNHPLVLFHQSDVIGVIRVDVSPPVAIFRRVAIRDDVQRRGHGTAMLQLAETFAREKNCRLVQSNVNLDAVGFYERLGFSRDQSAVGDADHVPMIKHL